MSHERIKCRILIVDDEREITEILADLLCCDFDCTVAGSAEEALTRLRDNPPTPSAKAIAELFIETAGTLYS